MNEYIGWLDEEWNTVLDQSQPIVRCRDCKHARKTDAGMDCDRHILCARFKPDGFCSWGERKRGAKMDYDAAEYQAAINPNTDFDR